MKKLLLFAGLAILFATRLALAQGISSEGKDFYLGYIYPTFNDVVPPQTGGYFRVYAYVSSSQDNIVSVSYFDPISKQEQYPWTYTVKARQTTQIPLDRIRMKMKNPGDTAGEFKSCHLTARKPINVQFFSSGANSGGSYLALPVNAWGKDYVVASYRDNGAGEGAMLGERGPSQLDQAGGVFMIIAAYNGTEVTITPTAQTGGGHTGVNQGPGANGSPQSYTVALNRGQCWLVKSKSAQTDTGTSDISGSIVKADKPVAIIAGHEDAYIDGSDVGGYNLDQRDFMVEQMIPVEYWDNTGHITIPFIDSPGNNGLGIGDHARIYVSDSAAPLVVHDSRNIELSPGTYMAPPATLPSSTVPVHFYADSGTKFMVVQYDIRNHGAQRTTPPFPSPSMMSIVPRALWRNAYMWYVPANVNEKLQAYYATIITPKDDSVLKKNWFTDSMQVSINGSNSYGKIKTLGAVKKTWNTIPDHPDLKATTFQLSPGTSYYVKAPFPFMAYHFGYRAVDFDGDLGDFDNDDNFFSYALPLGMALQRQAPRRLRVTVDTLCMGWNVCVYDSNDPGGIRYVMLLDDPNGEVVIGGHYQFKNTRFSPIDDPLNLREITPEPPKKELCFNVLVENPSLDAYAPLNILDINGKGKIVELRYKKQSVTFDPPDSVGLVFKVTDPPRDTVNRIYPPYVGEEVCKNYRFVNNAGSTRNYTVTNVDLPGSSNFKIKSVLPLLPVTLLPNDTLIITACFTGTDTMLYLDSIEVETDCFPVLLPLQGQAGTPIIVSEDHDFGTRLVGTTTCSDVTVKNIGNKPFTLDSNWVFNNVGEFQFPPESQAPKNKIPATLLPGQSKKFTFCYTPSNEGRDSTRFDWGTDIRPPYDKDIKSFTDLFGRGIMPAVRWDRTAEGFRADSNAEVVHRVNLINSGTAPAQLTRIWIEGLDADEFRIVGTETNTNPPTYAGTVLDTGDTMWVDVGFDINLTKIPPGRYRTAYLRTSEVLDSANIRTIVLTAGFDLSSVSKSGKQFSVSIRPNPARDKIFLDILMQQNSDATVGIYDVLGRQLGVRAFKGEAFSSNTFAFDLPMLGSGAYIVVVKSGEYSVMKQLIVE